MTYEVANDDAVFKQPRLFLFKDHRAISTDLFNTSHPVVL